jgi:hypothetical protein
VAPPLGWNALPTVIEQETAITPSATPASPTQPVWYYCMEPAGYFPYVQNCNRAWIPVSPQQAPSVPAS